MTETDKPAFRQVFSRLAVALREKETDAITMRVFFDGLQDSEIEFVVAAGEQLMVQAQWFPKVSEWRAVAVKVEAERADAQRAHLRKLPTPLCRACSDTSWANDAAGHVRPCDCRRERRLELLGRRPWPALPEAGQQPDTSEGPLTDAESVAAVASLHNLGFRLGLRVMPKPSRADIDAEATDG